LLKGRSCFISTKKLIITAAPIIFLVLCFLVAHTEEITKQMVLSYGIANKVIVVDPGHGGFDPGAWRGDIFEKDITLEISKRLAGDLSQAGAMVILLRKDDSDLAGETSGKIRDRKRQDLINRVKKANQAKADMYISVHANADPCAQWFGAQTFYNGKSEQSKFMAETIQEELTTILENTNRKAKPGNYYIIDRTEMPAVIVEVGFISNPKEAKLLSDPQYQAKVAYAIFSGVVKSQTRDNAGLNID